MFLTILIFIIILGLLVFVHELGHFLIAKNSGMKVEEFGFGFPPRLIGFQKTSNGRHWIWGHSRGPAGKADSAGNGSAGNGASAGKADASSHSDQEATIYSINAIPLGGFVRILGENNEAPDDPRSFINKPFWPRLLTLIGGVTMNFILAWLLISGAYIYGLPIAVDDLSQLPARAVLHNPRQTIVAVVPGSPAQQAGLRENDVLMAIDGNSFGDNGINESADGISESALDAKVGAGQAAAGGIKPYQSYIQNNKGKVFSFTVMRAGREIMLTVPSLANPPAGQGPTGIALATVGDLSFPWYEAGWEGIKTTVAQVGAIVSGLYHVIVAGEGLKSLGGPVKIAQLTGQVARLGFIHLVQFTALLSLNLAILNGLPFPALDGGRVLFLFIEKLRRKRNNQRMEQYVNTIGFLLLLFLMLIVTVRDVSNVGGLGRIIQKLIGG